MSDINKLPNEEEINENSTNTNDSTNIESLENEKPQVEETSSDASKANSVEQSEPTEPVANSENEVVENVETPIGEANTEEKKEPAEPVINAEDEVINEIEESNAEDAEDEGNKERHTIEEKDYDTMSLEALAIELEKLVTNEKTQAIRSHVDKINGVFKTKFQALVDEKKEEFVSNGGNELDFYYTSPVQKRYKDAYKDYRKKLNNHYQNIEKSLKDNLTKKLEIIEELKGLINVDENINTTYNHFKELQERWRTTGPIPRDKYNNAWNSYHHHVEIFYDFLHLNRDLRDLDFKHNLDKKLKIINRAEELAKDDNVLRAFRELQELHKMWKEELGPVGKEHREEIWEKFKAATKTINDKRQVYFKEIDKVYEVNLEKKLEIITKIDAVTNQENSNNHSSWQKKIKEIETLRNDFFNAGKVPIKVNESTWAKFKESVRTFNRKKNAFYKDLKKEQYTNLQKKLELIQIAEDNKESDDHNVTTPLMKKIQADWKKIGHVPRKDSDKIWKQFKGACNFYFDKLHASKNAENKEALEIFNKKEALLKGLKDLKLEGTKEEGVEAIKEQITQWKALGRVPNDKRFIEGKFQKTIDELLSSLEMDKNEVEIIKFENKLDSINTEKDTRDLDNERLFIRKKIDEVKGKINQLENNLQFFKNVDDNNPLVKEVHNNIKAHEETLQLWKTKLQKIKEFY